MEGGRVASLSLSLSLSFSFSLSGQHAVLLGDSSTNKIGVDTLKSKRLRL